MANDASTVFDLVILGGGSGGYAAALRGAQLGLDVALIEKDKVGGTCLHRGCIPTKALLHAGEIADQARESEQFGVKASFEGIDIAGVHKYKDDVISGLYKGLQGLVASRKVTYIEGEGRLSSPPPSTWAVSGSRAATSCWRPAPCRSRCRAWRSTATASSPPTTPSSWTACPSPRSSWAAVSSASSSPPRGSPSAPTSRSSRA